MRIPPSRLLIFMPSASTTALQASLIALDRSLVTPTKGYKLPATSDPPPGEFATARDNNPLASHRTTQKLRKFFQVCYRF